MSKNGMNIKFEGADELIQKFRDNPSKLNSQAGRIINTTALRVEKKAVELAPVDTGYLKQHIKADTDGRLGAEIVSSANYSIYLEKGTRKMPPHAFMEPAVKSEELFLYQKLSNLLKKGLL